MGLLFCISSINGSWKKHRAADNRKLFEGKAEGGRRASEDRRVKGGRV